MGFGDNMRWRPIIRVPAIATILRDGQLGLFDNEKLRLESDIAYATNEPDGRYFHVLDPTQPTGSKSITKAEFLTEANTALDAINLHIAKLQG